MYFLYVEIYFVSSRSTAEMASYQTLDHAEDTSDDDNTSPPEVQPEPAHSTSCGAEFDTCISHPLAKVCTAVMLAVVFLVFISISEYMSREDREPELGRGGWWQSW